MGKFRGFAATVAALVMLISGGGTAYAEPIEATEPGEVVAYVKNQDGTFIPLDEAIEMNDIDMTPSEPGPGTVTPQLINFNQWYRCFSLNQADEVFMEYAFYRDGTHHDVRLKCGEHNTITEKGYGYKHIRIRHEGDWQNKYNEATATGWIGDGQGIEGWDDLMVAGAGESITYWSYASGIKANNTRCTVGTLYFIEATTFDVVFQFNTVANFAINSDRLISAYPTSNSTC